MGPSTKSHSHYPEKRISTRIAAGLAVLWVAFRCAISVGPFHYSQISFIFQPWKVDDSCVCVLLFRRWNRIHKYTQFCARAIYKRRTYPISRESLVYVWLLNAHTHDHIMYTRSPQAILINELPYQWLALGIICACFNHIHMHVVALASAPSVHCKYIGRWEKVVAANELDTERARVCALPTFTYAIDLKHCVFIHIEALMT